MNRRFLFAILAFLPGTFCFAQLPHPRIWLDQALSVKVRAKVTAKDPTWTTLKAQCDLYLTGQVFWPDVKQYGDRQDIGAGYEGDGWLDPVMNLALAYQALKPTDPTTAKKYAAKLADVLTKMSEPPGDSHFVNPLMDDGYGIRFYGVGMALAYDLIYPELTTALKSRLINSMNRWISKVETGGFNVGNDFPIGNYYAGFYLAKALVAIGTEGDNPLAPKMWTSWLNTNHLGGVQPYFAKWMNGGGWPEGWDYGPLSVFNMIAAVWAAKTGKGVDLFNVRNTPFPYAHDAGQAAMEMTFPDQVTADTHGETYNSNDKPVPLTNAEMYTKLAGILQILGDSGAAQLHRFARTVRQVNGPVPLWVDFMFWDEKAPELGFANRPLSYFAKGTNMSILRSDWTHSAVWGNILAGAHVSYVQASHEKFDKGGLTVTRGNVRFLVQPHAELDQNSSPGAGDGGKYDFPPSNAPNSPNNFYNDDFGNHTSSPDLSNATAYNVFYTKNPNRWGQYAIDPTVSKANISRFEDGGSYTYTRCSKLEDNYWIKDSQPFPFVNYWTRDVLFLRPKLFVVRDRTIVHDAKIPQYLAWHFGEKPVYSAQKDNGQVDNRFDVSKGTTYKGALTSLFPVGGSTNLVNLFNSGRVFRVECFPSANPATAQSWLNVLDAAPSRAATYTDRRMSVNDGNVLQGTLFGTEMLSSNDAQIALFGTGSETSHVTGTLKFLAEKTGESVTIADLDPGTLYKLSATSSNGKVLVTLTPGSGSLKVSAKGILACRIG